MKEKVLVIEDEEAINDIICMNLQAAGYETMSVYDGSEAERLLKEGCHQDGRGASLEEYSAAILDVMLPGKDGFALLEDFRRTEIPVLMLTARDDVLSKVKGLRQGAEDYMVKPFEMLELLVRVEKIIQRSRKKPVEIQIRDVVIYPDRRLVTRRGEKVYLKPMEFECLMLFAAHPNIALTREFMIGQLWGGNFSGETRTIDVHVMRLRQKLGFADVIKTISRVGYRLEVEE
ncbi:MAG: response regulator transcription factor [Lachnospiraceae bacterium]|nr:response regulator transcription factor [Lachnospiraceae bacterium]